MKKQIVIGCLAFVVMLSLTGCPDKEVKPFNESNLTGDWILTAQTAGTGSPQDPSVFNDLPECISDNIFRYSADGLFQVLEGATKCSVDDPDKFDEGTWMIQGKEFSYTGSDGLTAFFEISSLSTTTFIIKQELNFAGQQLIVTATYAKQN